MRSAYQCLPNVSGVAPPGGAWQTDPMRIAGYVRQPRRRRRERPEPGFTQWERIRRWVDDRGELLVAVCQDDAAPRTGDPVAGMRALLSLLDSGAADTVVVASISVLGDPADQELALWEVHRRGGSVVSTDPTDRAALDGEDETGSAGDAAPPRGSGGATTANRRLSRQRLPGLQGRERPDPVIRSGLRPALLPPPRQRGGAQSSGEELISFGGGASGGRRRRPRRRREARRPAVGGEGTPAEVRRVGHGYERPMPPPTGRGNRHRQPGRFQPDVRVAGTTVTIGAAGGDAEVGSGSMRGSLYHVLPANFQAVYIAMRSRSTPGSCSRQTWANAWTPTGRSLITCALCTSAKEGRP